MGGKEKYLVEKKLVALQPCSGLLSSDRLERIVKQHRLLGEFGLPGGGWGVALLCWGWRGGRGEGRAAFPSMVMPLGGEGRERLDIV